ncbi:hypothetical protein Droror1_Dr00011016, partial [Drosera rotundifolia]
MIISCEISRSLRRSDLILGKWGFCFPVSHSCVSSAESVSSAVVSDSKVEFFSSWMHFSTVCIFIESILRYGLPPSFLSCVLAPSTKSEKKVRSILEGLCDTGNSMYWKSEDDAGAMSGLEQRQLIHCWFWSWGLWFIRSSLGSRWVMFIQSLLTIQPFMAVLVFHQFFEGMGLRGCITQVAHAIATSLCHRVIQVVTSREDQYENLKTKLAPDYQRNVLLTKQVTQKVWLVGEDLTENEQLAIKGTIFIPVSQFPPIEVRKDCFYLNTPAMVAPKSFRNLHSCE